MFEKPDCIGKVLLTKFLGGNCLRQRQNVSAFRFFLTVFSIGLLIILRAIF